jgi:virulence-associated protein VapD
MSKQSKLLLKILQGLADKNIAFDDLRNFLKRLGFSERISGGHYIFFKEGIAEIINLQPNKESKAKPYQVKQVREIIEKYNLIITKFDDND